MAENLTERQREHFDSIASIYHRDRQNPNHVLWKKLFWSTFFSLCPELRKEHLLILEPMCGAAEGFDIISEYVQPDIEYEGFDYSENMVEFAKKEKPQIKVWHQNIFEYEPQKQYDIIFIVGGLHHIPDGAGEAVRRLAPALKSGGYFINLEPTNGNPFFRVVREGIYKRNPIFDSETERAFSVKELNGFFLNNGFEIAIQMYPGLLSFVLYGNPYAFPKLNLGGERTVKFITAMEKWAWGIGITKIFSFLTATLYKKI